MNDFTIDLCEKSEREKLIQGEPSSYRYVPYVEAHLKINCSGLNKAGLFKQPYFICKRTGKRVKHLLVVEGLLKTRHQIRKMHYYSEHECSLDRNFRASRKIRQRFNKETAVFTSIASMSKPANIHHKTWNQWCAKEINYFEQIMIQQAKFLKKLEHRKHL